MPGLVLARTEVWDESFADHRKYLGRGSVPINARLGESLSFFLGRLDDRQLLLNVNCRHINARPSVDERDIPLVFVDLQGQGSLMNQSTNSYFPCFLAQSTTCQVALTSS